MNTTEKERTRKATMLALKNSIDGMELYDLSLALSEAGFYFTERELLNIVRDMLDGKQAVLLANGKLASADVLEALGLEDKRTKYRVLHGGTHSSYTACRTWAEAWAFACVDWLRDGGCREVARRTGKGWKVVAVAQYERSRPDCEARPYVDRQRAEMKACCEALQLALTPDLYARLREEAQDGRELKIGCSLTVDLKTGMCTAKVQGSVKLTSEASVEAEDPAQMLLF